MRKTDGSCRKDGCREDATEVLFVTIEVMNQKKEVQIPMCKRHHTLAVGNAVEGVSLDEPDATGEGS